VRVARSSVEKEEYGLYAKKIPAINSGRDNPISFYKKGKSLGSNCRY
jgi:hypothetical protein